MVVLLNIFVPVVVIALLYIAYKFKKLWPVLAAVAVLVIYPKIQPSYIPKGTVKPLPVAETQIVDKPFVDRVIKPMSAAERDERMSAEVLKSEQRREALIKQIKSEKE